MQYHIAHALTGILLRSYIRLSSRSFCNYVTKKEFQAYVTKKEFEELYQKIDANRASFDSFQELSKKIDANRADYDSFKAKVTGDVIIWGTPLIHMVAGDIVNFLIGNQGKRAESIKLEHSKNNEPFLYPGIEKAATKCNIKFHDFRRACDRSRVDRNRAAHAHDLEDLALKVAPVQDLFKKYPFLKQREADQYLLVSNFEAIRDVIEDLYGSGPSDTLVA